MLSRVAMKRLDTFAFEVRSASMTGDMDVRPWEIAVYRGHRRLSPWFDSFDALSAWIESETFTTAAAETDRP